MLLPLAFVLQHNTKGVYSVLFPLSQTLCVACEAETYFFFFISGAVSHLYPTRSTTPIAEISCSAPQRDRGDEYITVV